MRTNRWSIAVAGVLLQIALGAVYAWRRRSAFVVMFLLQVLLFWILPEVASVAALTFVSFVVLMRYGGGFGTMPAFTADYFGSKNVGPIYGLMLTAWGFATAFGPLLIAHMRQTSGNYRGALHVIAIVMLVSISLPLIVSPPRSTSWDLLKGAKGPHGSVESVRVDVLDNSVTSSGGLPCECLQVTEA